MAPPVRPARLLSETTELTTFAADDPEEVIVTAARRLDRGNFPITQVGA
jgi:hypothetical protein